MHIENKILYLQYKPKKQRIMNAKGKQQIEKKLNRLEEEIYEMYMYKEIEPIDALILNVMITGIKEKLKELYINNKK